MSEKDNNLTPWQQKHLEYQKRKAEEAKKEKKANQPKKVHFSSPFLKSLPKTEKNFDDTRDEAESAELLEEGFETNNEETQSSEAPIENEKIIAQLEQLSQENEYEYEEEQIKRPSRFFSLFSTSFNVISIFTTRGVRILKKLRFASSKTFISTLSLETPNSFNPFSIASLVVFPSTTIVLDI